MEVRWDTNRYTQAEINEIQRLGGEILKKMNTDKMPAHPPQSKAVVPVILDSVPVSAALRALLESRMAAGIAEYGTPLVAHNGRDARQDMLEEVADALCYAFQADMEGGGEHHYFKRLVIIAEDLLA